MSSTILQSFSAACYQPSLKESPLFTTLDATALMALMLSSPKTRTGSPRVCPVDAQGRSACLSSGTARPSSLAPAPAPCVSRQTGTREDRGDAVLATTGNFLSLTEKGERKSQQSQPPIAGPSFAVQTSPPPTKTTPAFPLMRLARSHSRMANGAQ